jgi:FkbM family methyltransferase
MKKFLKSVLGSLVVKLPWGARKAIIQAIADDLGPLHVIQDLVQKARVSRLETTGNYGVIISSATDRIVFGTYATTGWWARDSNDLIVSSFDGRSGTYLDIGANIGLTLIPLLGRPDVRCIGIEPDPTNFSNLEINVSRNSARNDIELHNIALFNKRTSLDFELAEGNLGDHRLRTTDRVEGIFGESSRQVISVPGIPLDDLIDRRPEGYFAIKLDTQGAEPFVIEGGRRTFRSADMLLLEFSPYHLKRLGGDPEVVLNLIEECFHTGCVAIGEGRFGEWMSSQKVAAFLRSEWHGAASDPNDFRYFDVCVKRLR